MDNVIAAYYACKADLIRERTEHNQPHHCQSCPDIKTQTRPSENIISTGLRMDNGNRMP